MDHLWLQLLRLVHVVGGAIWLGNVTLIAWFLLPTVALEGADGGRLMQRMVTERRLSTWLNVVGGLTILSGLTLYMRATLGTDGAFAELGIDHRRLRPNIVVGGVDGLAERQWPGRRLRIGPAIVEVAKLRARCVMTTYDPDTLEQDVTVLRRIASRFGGTMALDCGVVRGGRIAVGDPVELLEPDAKP
jgi:hypothetical protein